jgi:hypothetical protein
MPPGFAGIDTEHVVGALVSATEEPECVLTDSGVFIFDAIAWRFVEYREITLSFPFHDKRDPAGALTLHTPLGAFALLRGSPDLWEAGRYFMRCAEDAQNA